MGDKPDINRLIELYQLLLQFRSVKRMVRIPPEATEKENDLEHSYNLALAGWFLSQYFPNIDQAKVIKIGLVHDLVEIHAGDTFFFAPDSELSGKQQREEAALKQLESEWADFPEMLQNIKEYEDRQSEEAKFMYALDKIMPIIMNYLGGGHIWHEHNIDFKKFRAQKEPKVSVSIEINDYYLQFLEILKSKPELFPKEDSK